MSIAAGIPMPRIYISPDPSPNAFAAGSTPAGAMICVNQGLNNSNNPLAIVGLIASLLAIILAPLVAMMIQMSISRQREFLADASAAELTRYPQGLASALQKFLVLPFRLATTREP